MKIRITLPQTKKILTGIKGARVKQQLKINELQATLD